MNKELINRFEEYFPSMNSPVKDEEILIFLDKSYQNKFDRKIFNEIKDRVVTTQNLPLTPKNFATTYFKAYKQLRTIEEQARREIDSLRQTRKIISGGNSRSRPQNFSGFGGDSETNQKISGGTFDRPNSIQMSNMVGNEMEIEQTEPDQLMLVEFDPLNLHDFSNEFLLNHSIQTVFGNKIRLKITQRTKLF